MKMLLACFKILRLQGELSDKSLSPVEVWKQPLLWNSYSNPAITAWFAMAGERSLNLTRSFLQWQHLVSRWSHFSSKVRLEF